MPEQPDIGANIQKIRKKHDITLAVLAQRSKVSAATLSQIEADKVNPTIATLWKIAEGLEIDIHSLLTGAEQNRRRFEIGRKDDITKLDTEEEGVHIRVLTPLDMAGDIELYTLTFRPGGELKSRPHPPKTEEFLTVTGGRVRVRAGNREAELGQEDFIRYHADISHSITNIGEGPAVISMMVRFHLNG